MRCIDKKIDNVLRKISKNQEQLVPQIESIIEVNKEMWNKINSIENKTVKSVIWA